MEPLSKIDTKRIDKEYSVMIVSKDIIELIKDRLGDEILWDYDKDTNELFLIKKPTSFTDALTGLGEEMWKSVDGTEYIKQERESW